MNHLYFFFFQAEDGIRDKLVTGVQTCALPICCPKARRMRIMQHARLHSRQRNGPRLRALSFSTEKGKQSGLYVLPGLRKSLSSRSEERRVGKECRYSR